MFLVSSIITGLIQILFHVKICGIFVVYIHFRFEAAIFDIPLILTLDNVRTNAVMLLDLKNIGIDVGILLLSRIAALHVISYALPVISRHLWLHTHPDKRQCLNQSSRVAWQRNYRHSRWSCVAVLCKSWEIRHFIFTSDSRPPSLIFHPPWRRHVLAFVLLCCSMQRMRMPLKLHIIFSICTVRFKCFRFHVRHFDFRLNLHRIVHRALLLSAAVTSSNTNAATLNFLPREIYADWYNGYQVHQILTK